MIDEVQKDTQWIRKKNKLIETMIAVEKENLGAELSAKKMVEKLQKILLDEMKGEE